MKHLSLIAATALLACGCVTPPLENYAINQSLSSTEMRYQEMMNALATVAHNPGLLPSYAVTTGGVSNVSTNLTLDATTSWTRAAHNFGQQMLNIAGKHQPDLQWGIDPVADQTLLAGAWYACRWAVFGPPASGDPAYDLLRQPTLNDIVGLSTKHENHLGVYDDLHPIPYGWLGCGPHRCVPHGACYTAHCGDTYIWVMPDQMYQLAEFTLVMLDIATISPAWLLSQKQLAVAGVDVTMTGSTDGKSTISESWFAYQADQPDGSTKIVVLPFAEPRSHLIERSTLSLTLAAEKGTAVPTRTYAPQFLTPQYVVPAPGLPQSVHTYRQ